MAKYQGKYGDGRVPLGELKINASLNWQLYLQDMVKQISIYKIEGKITQLIICLTLLKQSLYCIMNKKEKQMHDEIQLEINKERPKLLLIPDMLNNPNIILLSGAKSNNEKEQKGFDAAMKIEQLCDAWLEDLVRIMEKEGMLLARNESVAGAF